jgi:serine/threonine protein kinase
MSAEPLFEAPKIEELQELLPAYDVELFIAQGGMGAVYKARQKSLERDVAIKILPREFGADPDFRESFETEAKSMAVLNDANLIGVFDFGEVDGMPYIVMEHVNGKSLHYSAHGKAIEQKEAARLAHGICKGLAHAHEAGILHRDIKPANILLDQKKRPKIGDFGLARPVDAERAGEAVFGTPGYSAPEVMNDWAAVDKRSDVFSTGVILYELLTGELPGASYVPVSQKGEIDPRFDKIIRRATHPSPTLRYRDAGAMLKDLEALLEALEKPSAATIVTTAPAAPKALAVDDEQLEAANNASAPGSSASAPPVVQVSSGHHWHFLRNLVIIVVLLAAIFGMWKALEWKKAYNVRKEQEQKQELNRLERLRLAEAERIRQGMQVSKDPSTGTAGGTSTPDPTPTPTPTPIPVPPPVETSLEVLARLRPALADGERTEFPPDTLERGSSRFFLVETPMTWAEAGTFAERHGGHLAMCPNESAADWLSSKIPNDTSIWLGGGAVGRNNWGWMDGSDWTLRTPSTATGTAATLSDLGSIRAKSPGELLPFFIQWHMDGSNPALLASQLQRTRDTLETNNPSWPPGSLTYESRRYLLVARPETWDAASELARLAGGHLAVASDEPEAEYLRDAVSNSLPADRSCWIGGQHNGRSWAWATGEPWTFAQWAEGSPGGDPATDSALRIRNGEAGGWDDADPADPESAGAFLIEWSNDPTTKREATNPGSRELIELRKKGSTAVGKLTGTYDKSIFENGKSLKWDLDFWLRGNQKDAIAKLTPKVGAVKNAIDAKGHIPKDIERSSLPFKTIGIVNGAIAKQQAIEDKYYQDLDRLRRSYLKRLGETKASLEQQGLASQARALDNEIAACGGNGREFLELFSP